jgi:hypothetical protein
LLQQGEARRAAETLEEALKLHPRHQRGRNLLGLALFKLGDLGRSESLYRGLIEDHPEDPTLRVNLGLVFLKSGSPGDAARCFETAIDLQPGHSKAHNYLGVALAQLGDFARARDSFSRGGNAPMADKMAQAVARPVQAVAESAAVALDAEQPFQPAGDERSHGAVIGAIKPTQWVVATPQGGEVPRGSRGERFAAALDAMAAVRAAEEETRASPNDTDPEVPRIVPAAPRALSEYTDQKRLSVPSSEGGFAIGPTDISVQVHGEMLTRLDGLVASWGSVAMRPELKRFRGKATDKPFGEGARRMLRATGNGRFVIAREGRQFTALELGDEPAYFREEILFAFEESLLFENGRVPSRGGADLHLVHLRGHGRLLLVTQGTPRAAAVVKGEPLRIPMDQLVGWHGPGIQPRLVPICDEAPELGVALELAGEGRALVDAPDEPR